MRRLRQRFEDSIAHENAALSFALAYASANDVDHQADPHECTAHGFGEANACPARRVGVGVLIK
jgi:hypothetical protein